MVTARDEGMATSLQKCRSTPRAQPSLAEAHLVMLGTIHRDTEGASSLSRWLDYLKPDVITLEFSRYGMMFRKTNGVVLRARLDALAAKMGLGEGQTDMGAVRALHDYIELPYEYTQSSQYAERLRIPLHLIDLDVFSSINLRGVEELLTEKNVHAWLHGCDEQARAVERQRALARLFFEQGVRTFTYTDEMLIRDRHMKRRLALLTRRYKKGRLVHVCGWQHLSDPHNLYDSLNPVKVFAHDRSFRI